MKTERELFEELQNKSVLKRLTFIDPLNMYLTRDEYSDDDSTIHYCLEINHGWKMWQASAQREGYKLVPLQPSNEVIVAIEKKVENQLEASGINQDPFRLDGETIYEAMMGAAE